jgi:hypothetical protein
MGGDEKDRWGDKLRDAERAREEQYFAERERKLVETLRAKEATTRAARGAEPMRCPKDATQLQQHSHQGVTVDECPSCHGMWLDHGDLQALAGKDSDGWIARWLRNEFRRPE